MKSILAKHTCANKIAEGERHSFLSVFGEVKVKEKLRNGKMSSKEGKRKQIKNSAVGKGLRWNMEDDDGNGKHSFIYVFCL